MISKNISTCGKLVNRSLQRISELNNRLKLSKNISTFEKFIRRSKRQKNCWKICFFRTTWHSKINRGKIQVKVRKFIQVRNIVTSIISKSISISPISTLMVYSKVIWPLASYLPESIADFSNQPRSRYSSRDKYYSSGVPISLRYSNIR